MGTEVHRDIPGNLTNLINSTNLINLANRNFPRTTKPVTPHRNIATQLRNFPFHIPPHQRIPQST